MKENKYTILIAEDEFVNYFYIKTLLEDSEMNCKIVHANNGQEAVDICNSSSIDIILMDVKMPIMDGLEATKKIKSAFPVIPIIIQSAFSTTEDVRRAQIAGCDGFVSKPVDEKLLLKEIYRLLELDYVEVK